MDLPTQERHGIGKLTISAPPELHQPLSRPAGSEPRSVGDKQSLGTAALPADYHARFSEDVHSYIREYIRNADQKAAFFFAAGTALLAFLHSRNTTSRWLKDIRTWSFTDTLAFLAMAGLASSAVVLIAVVFPRLKGPRRGILFFRTIAEHSSSAEYADEILRRSAHDIVRAKLEHSFDLSKVCAAKYRTLRVGFWIGGVGAVAALLFLFLVGTA